MLCVRHEGGYVHHVDEKRLDEPIVVFFSYQDCNTVRKLAGALFQACWKTIIIPVQSIMMVYENNDKVYQTARYFCHSIIIQFMAISIERN